MISVDDNDLLVRFATFRFLSNGIFSQMKRNKQNLILKICKSAKNIFRVGKPDKMICLDYD
jgi:hypothetical protein